MNTSLSTAEFTAELTRRRSTRETKYSQDLVTLCLTHEFNH